MLVKKMSRIDMHDEVMEPRLSRIEKNQDLYKDVYLNNTLIDFNNANFMEEEIEELEPLNKKVNIPAPIIYEEKNYDIDEYLKEAKEKRISDNLPRTLQNTDYEVAKVRDNKDEISQLIKTIEKKEKESDLFVELLPDNDHTVVTDPVDETKLDTPLVNSEVSSVTIEETVEKEFMEVTKSNLKLKKLPFFICLASFILLIVVIVIILVKKG